MNFLKKNAGKILILILSLVSIVLWASSYDLQNKFSTVNSTFTSLTQVFGIVGFLLFAINIIIGIRSKITEKIFNSIPDIYKLHKILGISSFLFLSFHPFFTLINYLSFSFDYALNFIFSFSDLALSLGKISLYAMFLTIFITLFLKIKYSAWKKIHQILSFSFFFGFLHVLFINSTVSSNFVLRYYLMFFAVFAISLMVYKIILNINLSKTFKYRVSNINFVHNNSMEIEMSAIKDKIKFIPGQFIFIKVNQDNLKEEHPFSISSGTNEENLKITIKNLGDYTDKLRSELKLNSVVEVDGPYGNFYVDNNKDKIFIAGGIGITPFLSILKTGKIENKITLFYCAKEESESSVISDIKKLQEKYSNLKIVEIYSSIRKRFDIDDIKNIENYQNCDIFMCASSNMMNEIKNKLIENRFDKKNIYFEEFNFKN